MPDAKVTKETIKRSILRKFVEPQLLDPPFSPVKNDLATTMEQLPKFWRYKSCRIALMATADLQGLVIDPAPLSTWDHVEHEALKVSRNCVGKKEGGGLVIIADPVGYGALTLYMYAVGSPFEALLTNYMITSEAVHPPNTLGQGSNGSLIWLAANGSIEAPPTEAVRLLQSIQ